jgi:hypothetical protein
MGEIRPLSGVVLRAADVGQAVVIFVPERHYTIGVNQLPAGAQETVSPGEVALPVFFLTSRLGPSACCS